MITRFFLTLITALFLAIPASFAGDWSKIKIGTEGAYPPWNGTNAAGELEGAEIDLIADLCARMNAECEIVAQDWDGIIPALQNGKYDAIIAGMSITEERMKVINFSQGYANEPASFSVMKSSALASLQASGKVNMDSLDSASTALIDALKSSLSGKVVGVQGSTTHENFVKQVLGDSVTMKSYDTQLTLELDLIAGRIDALLSDKGSMEEFMGTDKGNYYEVTLSSEDMGSLKRLASFIDAMQVSRGYPEFDQIEIDPVITRFGHCGVNLNDEVCQDI